MNEEENRGEGDQYLVIDLGMDASELLAEVQKISYHLEIISNFVLDISESMKQDERQ